MHRQVWDWPDDSAQFRRVRYTGMEEKWDFMRQAVGQLEPTVHRYDTFCNIAMRLGRQDIIRTSCYDYAGDEYALRVHLNMIEFPREYIVVCNIADAYVRAVLSDTTFYKDWYFCVHNARWKDCDKEFWACPQEDRKAYLTKCRALYAGIAVLETVQVSIRDWGDLVSEMEYFAGADNSSVFYQTFADMRYFNNAKVCKISEFEGCFDVYMAMSRNRLLLVTCGFWD